MSADNFVVVREFPEGWKWGMGAASNEYPGGRLPDEEFTSGTFVTAESAAYDAEMQCAIIEYGVQIEPPRDECQQRADEDTLERELIDLLNKHSREGYSNTPDFLLARYLIGCLELFEQTTQERSAW